VTCACKCCLAGAPCAHRLLLSPKDSSDTDRLWRRFRESGTEPGHVDLSKRTPLEQRAKLEPDEPMALVRCGGCRTDVAVFRYVADLLTAHRLGVNCRDCQEAA
jgi:hypothetical protein